MHIREYKDYKIHSNIHTCISEDTKITKYMHKPIDKCISEDTKITKCMQTYIHAYQKIQRLQKCAHTHAYERIQ